MADLTQTPRRGRIALDWLQSPWSLGALILLAVAILDLGNFWRC